MIENVLEKIADLRAVIEYDEEYMGDPGLTKSSGTRSPRKIGTIYSLRLKSGHYEVGGYEDLPFVEWFKTEDSRLIPFAQMLVWINQVQRDGLTGKLVIWLNYSE